MVRKLAVCGSSWLRAVPVVLSGGAVEVAEEFCYLGGWVQGSGKID